MYTFYFSLIYIFTIYTIFIFHQYIYLLYILFLFSLIYIFTIYTIHFYQSRLTLALGSIIDHSAMTCYQASSYKR